MIASDSRRQGGFAAVLVGALSLAGCGDLAHTNPLDRHTLVAVEVTGPDSAFSYRDTLTFVAHTVPSYAPEKVAWSSSGFLSLLPLGNGVFYITDAQRIAAAVDTVRVEVDGRSAMHVLKFVHRAASIQGSECVSQSRTLTLNAFGQQVSLCTLGFDARGYPAPLEGTPTVTATDSSVVVPFSTYSGPAVRAVGNGTSAVRSSLRGMSDSVIVKVWQRISGVSLDPGGCQSMGFPLYVGDSIQVSPTSRGTDPGGALVADTARVRAAVRGMTFALGDPYNGSVKVSPTGLVTAVHAGWTYVVGVATTPEEGTVRGACYFLVQDRP